MEKCVICAVVAFGIGFGAATYYNNLKFTEYQLEAEKQYNTLLKEKDELDRANRERVSMIEKRTQDELETQKVNYEKTISNLRTKYQLAGVQNCPTSGEHLPRKDADSSELVCYRQDELLYRIEKTLAIGEKCQETKLRYEGLLKVLEVDDGEEK